MMLECSSIPLLLDEIGLENTTSNNRIVVTLLYIRVPEKKRVSIYKSLSDVDGKNVRGSHGLVSNG